MASENKKSDDKVIESDEVQATKKDKLDAALKTKAQLEESYKVIVQYDKDADAIINDLNDRILKQRECKSVFKAQSIQIENEYNKVLAEINELKK